MDRWHAGLRGTMALPPLVQFWPVGTVAVWYGLAIYQVYRDRYRTWTEAFFLAGCFFVGTYGLADILFFNAPDPTYGALAAEISFTALTLAVFFIFLFSLLFYTRMRRIYVLCLAPMLGLVALVWIGLVPTPYKSSIVPLDTTLGAGPPWTGLWDKTVFAVWVAGCLLLAGLSAYFLLRTYREVASQTTQLRKRMLGLLLSAVLSLALGMATNTLRGFSQQAVPSLFSTALVLPGIVSIITLSPMSTERFSVAVRRWKASRYDIKAAFVIFTDGTLIGAKVRPGEKVIDQDLFGATLDVIQNFMRTSFPTLRGSLSAIKHGDFTLVVERGKYAYLTIILQGEENDQLRRHMRDILLKYENDNRPVLEEWRGMPSEAVGTDSMLSELIEAT